MSRGGELRRRDEWLRDRTPVELNLLALAILAVCGGILFLVWYGLVLVAILVKAILVKAIF